MTKSLKRCIIIIRKRGNEMTKVEKIDNDYVCECWSASTKHPDTIHYYSEWAGKIDMLEPEDQIFQWLLYLASNKLFPFHAKEMVEYALKNWYKWE